MTVEVIERECVANVGLSTQLSNAEVESVVQLVHTVNKAIDTGVKQAKQLAKNFEEHCHEYTETDSIPVAIELSTLVRIHWLLNAITNDRATKPSDLFNDADVAYSHTLCEINKIGE